MKPTTFRLRGAAALVVSLLAAACASTQESVASATSGADWLEPSETLRAEIEKQAERLPYAERIDERVQIISWFAGVGEPAYPTLLELAADPRTRVAGTALAALGSTRDARLVEPVRALPLDPDSSDLAREHARALILLGDWSGVPVLIGGLRDEQLYTRAVCISTLREATSMRFGFEPSGDPGDREPAVLLWEDWWERRRGDVLLEANRD